VIITRHGPVINSLAPDFAGEQPVALRWTSLEPDTMAQGVFGLMRARNVDEFHQALQSWTSPTQNVVYADVQGHIAYTFPGKLPVRARGQGRMPVPGWTDEFEWVGYIPYDALPHMIDPPQGYIASANNRAFSDDYPVPIALEPISGDRAQRISEMILDAGLRGGEEKIDIAFIKKMHFDQLSPSARALVRLAGQIPLDFKVQNPETDLHGAVRMLKEWDATLTADSAPAALYQAFIRRLVYRLLSKRLGEGRKSKRLKDDNAPRQISLIERLMGAGPTPVLAEHSWWGESWLPWLLARLPNEPDREELMRLALQDALSDLRKRLGPDQRKWAWGRLHQLTFRHALSANPLMKSLFSRGPFPLGGDHTTIWATGASYQKLADDQVVGPPYRMICDLADWDNSQSLLAPGQSGNPASPHYDDQVQAWFKGGYHNMWFSRAAVEKNTKSLLTLKPR
jgi:penicillin amidase